MRLLSWNVGGPPTHPRGLIHGLLRALSGSPLAALVERALAARGNRIEECARYIREGGHDFACVQEAWLRADVRTLSAGWPYDWRQWLPGLFPGIWPFSGLLTLARCEPSSRYSLRYSATSWNKTDWLARKGAAFTRWPFGWLCTTHLDSGRKQEDIRARNRQVDELLPQLMERRPFVLAGDLNLHPDCVEDERTFQRLLAGSGATCVARDKFDCVLASQLEVRCLACPTVPEKLSDHPPLCVEIS